jgi:hypothetical protein
MLHVDVRVAAKVVHTFGNEGGGGVSQRKSSATSAGNLEKNCVEVLFYFVCGNLQLKMNL